MNIFKKVLTLSAGDNLLADLMRAANATFRCGFMVELTFRVVSATGSVSKADFVMAAATDGGQYLPGQGDTERATAPGSIDANLIHFYGAAGDKIFVEARAR